MWLTLISNWKTIAAGIIFLALAIGAVFIVHTLDQKKPEARPSSATTAIDSTMPESATDHGEANAKLEQERDAINKRLNALLVQHPAKCLYIASSTHKASGGAQYAGRDGVDSSALRRYAATCESYRSELLAYIDFCGQRTAIAYNTKRRRVFSSDRLF